MQFGNRRLENGDITMAPTAVHKLIEQHATCLMRTESNLDKLSQFVNDAALKNEELRKAIDVALEHGKKVDEKFWEQSKSLNERIKSTDGWLKIEDEAAESAARLGIKKYYEIEKGVKSIDFLDTRVIFGSDGNKVIELDGLMEVEMHDKELFLVTVENKHRVKKSHVDERKKKLIQLEEFMKAIPKDEIASAHRKYNLSCTTLRPYTKKNRVDYIGGKKVSEDVLSYAKAQGFLVYELSSDFHCINML